MRRGIRLAKTAARDLAGEALYRLGVTAPRRAHRDRLVVVMFHRVLPPDQRAAYPLPELVVTPRELEFFARFFAQHHTCTTLSDGARRFRAGERPERPFLCLTFDDGQLDNFVHARPVLARAAVPATFYVVSGAVGTSSPLWHDRIAFAVERARAHPSAAVTAALAPLRLPAGGDLPAAASDVLGQAAALGEAEALAAITRAEALLPGAPLPAWDGLMNEHHLRTLRAEGHEVGSHSRSHPNLTKCSDDALTDELGGSKAQLERVLGAPVTSFCYPGGAHDARVAAAARTAGYDAAVTTVWGHNHPGADLFTLRRWDMQGDFARVFWGPLSPARLAFRLSGLHPGLRV